MKSEIIKKLAYNGFAFTSDYKVKDIAGRYVGIEYNKDSGLFGIFIKRNTYFFSDAEINKLKNDFEEVYSLVCELNNENK